MRSRVLEIVVFLMDYLRDKQGRFSGPDEVFDSLEDIGFSQNEISSAYNWLMDKFGASPEQYFAEFPKVAAAGRILSSSERLHITPEAYGLLIKLVNLSLINHEDFEIILDRAMILGTRPIDADQIRMITSAVIFREFDQSGRGSFLDIFSDQNNNVN